MNNKILSLANNLDILNKKYSNNRTRMYARENIYNSRFLYFTHFLNDKNFYESPYRNLLINYFNKAERIYPGSSYFVSVDLVNKIHGNNNKIEKNVTDKNLNNLEVYLKSIINEEKYYDLILNILKFAGPDASIDCKPTKNKSMVVTKKKHPQIFVNLHQDFNGVYFSNQKTTTKTFIVSVMDAYIERESEIMTLLEYSKEQKTPIMLFCRGLSDNAVRNLKSIILKNNIYLYPYIIKFDNNDPFILDDIANILSAEKVSAEAGDSFYKDLIKKSSNKEIKAASDFIEVLKPNKEYIKEINDQIKNSSNEEELRKYLFKRKKRCSPNVVEVSIPDTDIRFLNEIKSIIYCYNKCVRFGFLEINNKIYSKSCIDTAEILSEKLFNTLNNIGYVLKLKSTEEK